MTENAPKEVKPDVKAILTLAQRAIEDLAGKKINFERARLDFVTANAAAHDAIDDARTVLDSVALAPVDSTAEENDP